MNIVILINNQFVICVLLLKKGFCDILYIIKYYKQWRALMERHLSQNEKQALLNRCNRIRTAKPTIIGSPTTNK